MGSVASTRMRLPARSRSMCAIQNRNASAIEFDATAERKRVDRNRSLANDNLRHWFERAASAVQKPYHVRPVRNIDVIEIHHLLHVRLPEPSQRFPAFAVIAD